MSTIDTAADCISEAVDEYARGQPLAVLGHSFGAIVAYEVVRRLASARPGSVSALIVAGQKAPGDIRFDYADDDEIVEWIRSAGATPERLLDDQAARSVILKPLRADLRALADYLPQAAAPFHVRVLAIAGDNDPYVQPHDLPRWASYTKGELSVYVLEGDHMAVHDPRTVRAIRQWMLNHCVEVSGR